MSTRTPARRLMSQAAAATAVVAACAGLAACGSSGPTAATTTTTKAAAAPTVKTAASAEYGTILVDSAGRTLYMNSGDTPSTTVCTPACYSVWPRLVATGSPQAGPGIDASLLGTRTLAGGVRQVTYNGHLLYSFVRDTAAGQVNGEGIVHFGGTWWVLDAAGNPVKVPLTTATTKKTATTASSGY